MNLAELVHEAANAGEGRQVVHVSEVFDAMNQRSSAALIFLPAILTVSPLSGIPLFSTTAGAIIALVAFQLVIGRSRIWLPRFLGDRGIDRNTYLKAIGILGKGAGFLDHIFKPRLLFLSRRPFTTVLQLVCLLLALTMPLLEFIPMSSSIAAATIAFFSVALVTRDGAVALAGFLFLGTAGILGYGWIWG